MGFGFNGNNESDTGFDFDTDTDFDFDFEGGYFATPRKQSTRDVSFIMACNIAPPDTIAIGIGIEQLPISHDTTKISAKDCLVPMLRVGTPYAVE